MSKELQKENINKRMVEDMVVDVLKTIFDPEIPVDIYELGLIYEIRVDDTFNVEVDMTLTSPSCPVAESLPVEVEEKVKGIWCVENAKINLVWNPPWSKEMMSEEAQLELGFM